VDWSLLIVCAVACTIEFIRKSCFAKQRTHRAISRVLWTDCDLHSEKHHNYFIFDSCGAIRVVRFGPDSLAAFWNLSSLSSIAIPRRVEVIRKFGFCMRSVTEPDFEPDSILA
jgi:hypothetical protein